MSDHVTPLPLPVRMMNLAGRAMAGLGYTPVTLKAPALFDRAEQATGLDDYGGDEFRAPLAKLLEELESDARLSWMGRLVAQGDLVRILSNRLELVDFFKKHPEVAEQRIEAPIIVVGPPRSGTTIFHDLLEMDPDNRVPLSWETAYPLPPPEAASFETDPRIARVQADLDQVDKLVPEFKKMHPMGAKRAQECVAMLSHDFAAMIFQVQFDVSKYDEWVATCDMSSAFRWHRRFLQVLQWKTPGKRWALKSPQHLWHLEQVHREYPDARFVQTHRDPVRVLVSISSLTATLRRLSSDHVELQEVARYYAKALAQAYDHTIDYRETGVLPREQVVDLHFRDFVRDQVGTVRRAYEHFGLELSAGAASAMQGFLDDNPADKHGRHFYQFLDTGLDEDEVRAGFERYQRYFDIEVEPV